jgi:hypothetical protein
MRGTGGIYDYRQASSAELADSLDRWLAPVVEHGTWAGPREEGPESFDASVAFLRVIAERLRGRD